MQELAALRATRSRHSRRAATLLVGIVAAAACVAPMGSVASAQKRAADSATSWTFEAIPPGFTGAYLAARQAESRKDFKAAAIYYRRAMRARPRDSRLTISALRYSLLVGDIPAATAIAEWMMFNKSRSPHAPLILSIDLIRSGKFAEARAMLEKKGREITPVLRDLLIGWAAYGAGDTEAAFKAFSANPSARGKTIYGSRHAGHLAMLIGDPKRAAAAFEASKKALGGWTRDLALTTTAAYQAAGDKAQAIAVLDEALKISPFDEILIGAKARLDAGQPVLKPLASAKEGAAAALTDIARAVGATRPEIAEFSLSLAQLAHRAAPEYGLSTVVIGQRLADLKQLHLSVEAYARAPRASVYSIEARFGRALVTARLKDMDGAISQTKSLLDEGARSPDLYHALGSFASHQKSYLTCATHYEKGIARLKEVLGAMPARNWAFHYRAGVCRERAKQWDKAEAHFKAALALKPGQADVLNYYGYSLVEQRDRLGEARKMIERAVKANPKSGHIVDSLGWVMWRTGDYKGAVRELARAVAMEPLVYEINDHYGDALWMVGRKREARFHWRRALTLKPTSDSVIARIKRKLAVGLDVVLAEEKSPLLPPDDKRAAKEDGKTVPGAPNGAKPDRRIPDDG